MRRLKYRTYSYEWKWWDDFLLPAICPKAVPLRAQLGESHISVLSRLPDDCECFIFHVNLTDTSLTPFGRSELCAELAARSITVLNGGVTNISKRTVQDTCVRAGLPSTAASREGDPDELLVAKTDRNALGSSEAALSPAERACLQVPRAQTLKRYIRVRRRDMPDWLWNASDVVLERWIDNEEDTFYRAYLMCAKVVVSKVNDPHVFKRMPDKLARKHWFLDGDRTPPIEDIPVHVADAVFRFRQAMALDYGALDIVQDRYSACYVVDANATPLWGNLHHAEVVEFLATALPS